MSGVLITGGAGFIGSALATRLCGLGHEVTIFDNLSRGKIHRIPAAARYVEGDIRNRQDVYRAMAGNRTVIHLAYLQGTQTFYAEPRQVLDVAVRGMLTVLDACESTGCADMLLVSSSEAYQVATTVPTPETVPLTVPDVTNPRYSYGGGKIACELMAQAWQRTGVLDKLVIARPHNIFGPDMGWEHVIPEFCARLSQLAKEQPEGVIPFPIQGSGKETRSFCYIDDCVAQLTLLLDPESPGGIYHVGEEDERSIEDVAHEVAWGYSREIKIQPGTLPKGSPPRRLPDTRKIRALGDWYHTPFVDGMDATVKWYKTHER